MHDVPVYPDSPDTTQHPEQQTSAEYVDVEHVEQTTINLEEMDRTNRSIPQWGATREEDDTMSIGTVMRIFGEFFFQNRIGF